MLDGGVTSVLIDARTWAVAKPILMRKLQAAKLVGLDIETQDANRHEGLNLFMKTDDDGRKAGNRPLVFDTNRTTVTGLSLYADGDTEAYYLNLAHADVENTLPWSEVEELLNAKNPNAYWICHHAKFERTMMLKSLGWELRKYICTMQMAVSAYSPDEYSPQDFLSLDLGPVRKLLPDVMKHFALFDGNRQSMTAEQGEIFAKFCGKESDAAHSYNGWVRTISRPYGLKQAVKYWFGYEMQTFDETLDGNVHMGQLTGEQVVSYGADDAVWAVRLYHRLLEFMISTNPACVKAFFEQELPCIDYYSDVWAKGMVVNREAILAKRIEERSLYADTLRSMRTTIRELLPFPENPHGGLLKYDSRWYENNWKKYRWLISNWAALPDTDDDIKEILQVRGAIPIALAQDLGRPEPVGLSIAHYMPIRTIIYDLLGQKLIVEKGKTQSDGEARAKLKDRLEKLGNPKGVDVINAMATLASVEQRAKLYLNPYSQLTDPDTDRIYPEISSELATRRTSISRPNGQQLAKRGESKYIRGFYMADYDDHVILSCDWSSVELVLVGEFSGDPEFRKAFGQLPYEDLHLGATASCLGVILGPELMYNVEANLPRFEQYGISDHELSNELALMEWFLRKLKSMSVEDVQHGHPRLLVNLKGELMEPKAALKYWRTEVGKKANFGYWYSGALSDVGQSLGWESDQMWSAVDAYRQRFAVAEAWRLDTIRFAQEHGYTQLPDGHRRTRYECTYEWSAAFMTKFNMFNNEGISNFGRAAMKAIQTRANNQVVNAKIQGSCASMMKRSILRLQRAFNDAGLTDRDARLLIPIHDELLVSVHKTLVNPVIKMVREAMCEPDIVVNLPLTVAPAIGKTFLPWNGTKMSQVELGELSDVPVIPKERWGQEATEDEVNTIIDWIFENE